MLLVLLLLDVCACVSAFCFCRVRCVCDAKEKRVHVCLESARAKKGAIEREGNHETHTYTQTGERNASTVCFEGIFVQRLAVEGMSERIRKRERESKKVRCSHACESTHAHRIT